MSNQIIINTNELKYPFNRNTEINCLRRIIDWLEINNSGIVNPSGIESFFRECKVRKYKNRYISNMKGVIKKSILVTLRDKMISSNENLNGYVFSKIVWEDVFAGIKIKKSIQTVDSKPIPTPEEILKMVESESNPIRSIMIAFTYSMGLRNSEVRNILLTDISRSKKTVMIGSKEESIDMIYICSKNQNERLVPVRSSYIDFIIEVGKPVKYLFERLPGIPFSDRTFQRIVEKASKSIGKDYHPHLLRHSLGTEIYERTLDVVGGANYLGHQPKIFTGTYAHPKQKLDIVTLTPVDQFLKIAGKKVG